MLAIAARQGARSFDAPGARYTHRDGKCSFEVLIEEYNLVAPGLDSLARIVHAADIAADEASVPEGAGFKAIAEGFALTVESDVERQHLQWPIYDALLAWCARREQGDDQGEDQAEDHG